MNVALTDDLQRLLRKKVEDGQFPNEEAVVQQALRSFLVEDPAEGSPQKSCEPRVRRNACRVPSSRMTRIVVRSSFPGTAKR